MNLAWYAVAWLVTAAGLAATAMFYLAIRRSVRRGEEARRRSQRHAEEAKAWAKLAHDVAAHEDISQLLPDGVPAEGGWMAEVTVRKFVPVADDAQSAIKQVTNPLRARLGLAPDEDKLGVLLAGEDAELVVRARRCVRAKPHEG